MHGGKHLWGFNMDSTELEQINKREDENMVIKIKPIKVVEYPQQKYAHYLMISDIRVNLIDKGVKVVYSLLDEQMQVSYNTDIMNLTEEEIAGWNETDRQLLQIIINKLNLEVYEENNL